MDWTHITKSEISDKINAGVKLMNAEQKRLWDVISLAPEKWSQEPYGNQGGGFWVVAIIGNTVIWYNDIEEGFNNSTFSKYRKIDDYWCNQDNLEWVVQNQLNRIGNGN